ncbi:outer membrane beta-barrel protein [Enterovibrio sp. ZSDZ42]|uniref:Outer membrane beta-barrel protein n=1 Tax=Enterovibrio gelatinilyticus TaxID=2899819 RepID=A0ABT5QY66_9GAMM|nr:outer membrane beta-barrel protein [Enterovibrio sp. ZSDZ42]MDD1792962.1 outer membrane beta-barrel protein [Enterovibrio sp. ZSDZ42]
MNCPKKTLITVALLSYSSLAIANEDNGFSTESGIKVTPLFNAYLEHNDNVGRYSSSESPESSNALIVSPGIMFESDRNGNEYQIAYLLASGTYFDSDEDDFLDHTLTTNNFIQVSQRSGFGINYTYEKSHEARGTGILAGDELTTIATEPVRYALHNANVTHVYGAEDSTGRIESNLRYENKVYENYRDLTAPGFVALSTRFKDYDEVAGSLAFYYKVFPATDLLVEVDLADRQYKLGDPNNGQSQNNLDAYYLVGAKWDITGKTTGKLRLGIQDKNYEDETREDFNGFSWDLDLTWEPLTYSMISISAAQSAIDPDQGNNFINQTSFGASWKHFWLTNVYSDLALNSVDDDYSQSTREDDLIAASFNLGYEFREDTEIRVGWRYEDNDSSIETNRYSQNVWYLGTNLIF